MSVTEQNTAPEPISICFEQRAITVLFSELLRTRGVSTRIIEDPNQLPEVKKIITEPRFFSLLNKDAQSNCLLVGARSNLFKNQAITLSQPLTEQKIEGALSSFLKSHK